MFLLRFFKPIRDSLRIFSSDTAPTQLALGLAMGLLIGLLPKGNLIAIGLTVVLFALRMNLGTGLVTTFIVSLFANQLDPLTHGIGLRVLRHPICYRQLMSWYELPVVPWTSLNNTVVMGGLILGVALFYPVYSISESLFRRTAKWKTKWNREKASQTHLVQPTSDPQGTGR